MHYLSISRIGYNKSAHKISEIAGSAIVEYNKDIDPDVSKLLQDINRFPAQYY